MFRPMRRPEKALSDEATRRLLLQARRGVLAVNGDDGYPYACPVNSLYDPSAGKIYFHGAARGHKADALRRCDKACFTVYGGERRAEGEWAPCLQSAVIFDRCRLIADRDVTAETVHRLVRKYYPDEDAIEVEMQKAGRAVPLYERTVEHMTGKEIQEK